MTKLITKQPKRLFAVGCSFTRYVWTTWPELIAEDLDIEQYYNLGAPGAGNEFIFNRLMQADRIYNFNEDDLVMVCWSNIFREDNCVNRSWHFPGNIFAQHEIPADYIKKYYLDTPSIALHDFAYIKAGRMLLENRNCQRHYLQMLDLKIFKSRLLNDEAAYMQPSFYEVLWNNEITDREEYERKVYNTIDGHPRPNECLKYLSIVFEHDWKKETIDKVNELDAELHIQRSTDKEFETKVRHLRDSLPLSKNII